VVLGSLVNQEVVLLTILGMQQTYRKMCGKDTRKK
jgi:hypothetical protein